MYTYVYASGMWRVCQVLELAEAWSLGGLALYRKRKPFKRTGTVTPEASTTTLTLTTWSLVLSKGMTHLQ